MTKLRCCFCQQELVKDTPFAWNCPNEECVETDMMWGTANMWQELIRTRKALEIAMGWLGQVATPEKCDDDLCREFTKRKLAEIKTALEQKD